MEKQELVIQALQERIGQLVSQYETHVAVLRAEITSLANSLAEKQEENKPLTNEELLAKIDEQNKRIEALEGKKSKCASGNCSPEEEQEIADEEEDIKNNESSVKDMQARLSVMDIRDKYRWNAASRFGNLLTGSSDPGRPGQLRERTYHYEFGKKGQMPPGAASIIADNSDVWKKWQNAPGAGVNITTTNPTGGISTPENPFGTPVDLSPNANPDNKTSNSSYTIPEFDINRAAQQTSTNEQNNFATEADLNKNWYEQKKDNWGGRIYSTPADVLGHWGTVLEKEPWKKDVWNSYLDIPAPLKDIAFDHMFNASSDPRIFTLAAAGAIDMKDSLKYKNDKTLLNDTWNKNKDYIKQQYNDDPQAFTEAVSDYRNLLYAKSRTLDVNGKPTDYPSTSGTPGIQYNAWSGRTNDEQKYIDNTYFNEANGYKPPVFFQKKGGGLTKFMRKYQGDQGPSEVFDPGMWEIDTGEDFGNNQGLGYNQAGTAQTVMPIGKAPELPEQDWINTGQDITMGQNFGMGAYIAPIMEMVANRRDAAKQKKGDVMNKFGYENLVNPVTGDKGVYDQFGNQFPDKRNFNMYYGKSGGEMYQEGGVYFLDDATIKQLKAGGAIIEYID